MFQTLRTVLVSMFANDLLKEEKVRFAGPVWLTVL